MYRNSTSGTANNYQSFSIIYIHTFVDKKKCIQQQFPEFTLRTRFFLKGEILLGKRIRVSHGLNKKLCEYTQGESSPIIENRRGLNRILLSLLILLGQLDSQEIVGVNRPFEGWWGFIRNYPCEKGEGSFVFPFYFNNTQNNLSFCNSNLRV